MIIHRTYSEEGTGRVHIPFASDMDYRRLVWRGSGLYRNRLSVEDIAKNGRRVKVIPKESHAHS